MRESDLRAAASRYLQAQWQRKKLGDSVFNYMHDGPGEALLRQIDEKITDLVLALQALENDPNK